MSISFIYDKQIKRYCIFVLSVIFFLYFFGWAFIVIQTNTVQAAFLEHENAIVTSLLGQGVSREVIGAAVSSTKVSDAGSNFLASIGRTRQAVSKLFPFTAAFERITGEILLTAGICFSLLLLAGTYLFLLSRDRLYQRAIIIIDSFLWRGIIPSICPGREKEPFISSALP